MTNSIKKDRIDRKDKLKNKAAVIRSRLKDPLKTTREVEEETGVDHVTVSRRDRELKQSETKDDRILGITNKDIKIVELANEVRLGYVEQSLRKNTIYNLLLNKEFDTAYNSGLISEEEYDYVTSGDDKKYKQVLSTYKLSTKETLAIDKISETSQKRYSIFVGDITDDKGGLKDIQDYDKLSPKELEDIRQKLLGD